MKPEIRSEIHSFSVSCPRQNSAQNDVPNRFPRQLMTARELKKLLKREKETIFLVVVRCVGKPKIGGKVNAAVHVDTQGLIEKKKRDIIKASSPKKEFLSVKEQEEEILEGV